MSFGVKEMKMNRIYIILSIALLCLCFGFAEASENNTAILKKELGSLNLTKPEKDLIKNIEANDFRFVCICGYTCFAPGVEKENIKLTEKYGLKCIKGTNDVIENKEYGDLMQSARDYAMKYNLLLMYTLIQSKKP
jgi:hypothetical protein